MTIPRLYDSDRTRTPYDRDPRIDEDAPGYAWFTLTPENDDEPERTFRVWITATGDGDWEIVGIDESIDGRFYALRGAEYDEIHELALYDPAVEAKAKELWLW